MEKPLLFTEPMITAPALSAQWSGMSEHKFVNHLEKIGNRTEQSIEQIDEVADFPQPFWTEGTRENPDTRELVTVCWPWQTPEYDADSEIRRYGRGHGSLFKLFCDVVFKCEEVERYEKNHPEVLHKLGDTDVAWKKCKHRIQGVTLMEELKKRLAKAERIKAKKEDELEALRIQIDSKCSTTVNAKKWKKTVNAVLDTWVHIIQGDKTDWKKEEFSDAIAEKYNDYHTTVTALGWEKLPECYKGGRGRPKKPKK